MKGHFKIIKSKFECDYCDLLIFCKDGFLIDRNKYETDQTNDDLDDLAINCMEIGKNYRVKFIKDNSK